MKTITVTGGFSGTAVADLTDSLNELGSATVRAALVEPDGVAPAVGDSAWVAVLGSGGERALEVTDEIDPGVYNLAFDVETDGDHELVWATERNGRRALVRVV